MLDTVLDVAEIICLLLGALLSVAAGIGLIRFPDAIARMHATTKPQILGLTFVLVAIALEARSWTTLFALSPVLIFQMLTAPIAAHMVGRAGYRSGAFRAERLLVDELDAAIEQAERQAEGD